MITGVADEATLAQLGMMDVIVLLDVIEHLPAPHETLSLCTQRLNPGGKIYLMVSSDTDLDLFGSMIDKAGFNARQVREHSLVVESLIIYELLPR